MTLSFSSRFLVVPGASFFASAGFALSAAGAAAFALSWAIAGAAIHVAATIADARSIADFFMSFSLGVYAVRSAGYSLSSGGANEANSGDFRRDSEAHGRAPIAGAAADVDPHLADALESRGERLLQAHEEVPRPELAAMGMSRELQLVAGLRCVARGAALVGEENFGGPLRRPARGGLRIAAMRGIEVMRRPVRDAGDRERRAVVIEHHVLVDEDARAQAAQLADPCVGAGVVLVVAGDDIRAVARFEPREGLRVVREVADRAVDEIAGDRDHVGAEPVHALDDLLDERPLDRRPHVQVADLRDGEAFERCVQPRDGHLDLDHARDAPRHDESDDGDGDGEPHHSERGDPRPRFERLGRKDELRSEESHVASQGEHEEPRKEPGRDPRREDRPRAPIATAAEAFGHQGETKGEDPCARGLGGEAERQQQPNANVEMEEGEDDEDRAKAHGTHMGALAPRSSGGFLLHHAEEDRLGAANPHEPNVAPREPRDDLRRLVNFHPAFLERGVCPIDVCRAEVNERIPAGFRTAGIGIDVDARSAAVEKRHPGKLHQELHPQRTLSVLVFAGPKSLGELAAAEQVKPPTMSRVVESLVGQGLVTRMAHESDRPAVRIAATPKGRKLLLAGRDRRVQALAKRFEALTAAELNTLRKAATLLSII